MTHVTRDERGRFVKAVDDSLSGPVLLRSFVFFVMKMVVLVFVGVYVVYAILGVS